MDWARREVFDMALEIDKIIEKKLSEQEAEDLIEDLKKILSNRWDNAVRESLIWAIGTLEKIKTDPSIAEAEMIEARVRAILNMPVEEAKRRQLLEIQEGSFMRGAKAAVKGAAGVSIAWNTEDIKAINTLDENLQFWIGSFFDDNLQEGFKATLQDFFMGGYNRKQLVELMHTHFKTLGKKGEAYWDLLADHTVTKTREIGRVSGYEQAGVDAVRIKARIDDKTSAICRKLNGKVIAVSDLRNQVGKYLDACDTRNKDKIKKAWPWWTDKDVENKLKNNSTINRNIKRGKIGLPPFHGRCFVPGTIVKTPTGGKKIECVAVGDEVMTHVGKENVMELFKSDFYGFLVEICVGNTSITCTGNHPICVVVDGDVEWVPARDITMDSEVVLWQK